MFYTLLFIYIFYVIIKLFLANLQISFVRAQAKKEPVVLEESEYKNAAVAAVTNLKFEIFSLIYHAVIFFAWISFGLKMLSDACLKEGTTFENIIFVMSFLLISSLLDLPLNIYESFVKDKKLGFSNMSAKIFLVDTIKSLALMLVFGSAFVWLVLLCINFLGDFWWFWAFLLSFGIALIINLIYPTLIAPIFNKMSPLEDGELKGKIEGLLKKCGFKSSGVFTIDASKRDNRLNAYFGGLGATKRVVLFDTLIKKLSTEEIVAVLGHELGHFKHKDILKMIALSAIMLFCLFFIFGNVSTSAYEAIGLGQNGASIIIFLVLFSPIFSFLFSPIISHFSRKNEFGADRFSKEISNKTDMINALTKLGSENKAFPKSHWLYSFVYHSHPSLFERINELENES